MTVISKQILFFCANSHANNIRYFVVSRGGGEGAAHFVPSLIFPNNPPFIVA